MPTKVVVPTLGESVLEATVSQWLKAEGEFVQAGEALVELETDKVNVEVGAEHAGVLSQIERKEGEDVKVGDVLATIEETAEGQQPKPAAPPDASIRQGQPEAAAATPPAEAMNIQGTADSAGEPVPSPAGGHAPTTPEPERVVSPVARRMADEMGIDINRVPSIEASGRVTKEAVESYLKELPVKPGEQVPSETPTQTKPASRPLEGGEPRPAAAQKSTPAGDGRVEERSRMSRRRRTIAQRLVEVQQTAAMLTTFNEVDMSAVMDLRKRRNEAFQARHGVKVGITSFFVKGVIGAIKDFPQLNAEIQGDEIVIKHYFDIGIAVGAEEGLVVPVLREADRLSFPEIEKKINEFAEKAKNNSFSIEDLRGGTFTITNGGVFGSLLSTPILNPPQVGILGLHKIEPRPVVIDNELQIRPMMYIALSYDHRIVDGREAVQFLVRVKTLIEDPETLLLEG